ncbi:uncharacterized protein TrAFT101_004112 [Trichoderma asperellum]|uniref:uncharacterized protein n=1 Tax=Trichoderma asperellum TaxID=101201 RepID=UPI003326DA43|nr:hypothetical protein TrAFT101_004112 [Trichoderma asperellum]
MTTPELTLIVAATRSMGIGFQGTMPWKGLKREMQYFARVTTRVPTSSQPPIQNAVIMGRKTWDSIPPKFRPLKNRLNIVITRSAPANPPPSPPPADAEVRVPSVEAALKYAAEASSSNGGGTAARVFVMGGAQIYEAALTHPLAKRVLLTSIDSEFECDTWFPLDLTGGKAEGWERKSKEELQAWTGEEIDEGGQEEAGVKYEFQMWEKKD